MELRTSIGAIVEGGTSVNYKTGSWREFRPFFVARLAPCREACPAGIDIAHFLWEVKQKRYDQAWKVIMKENPLPSVCGRVCGHPCEQACNRNELDEPLAICSLERFVGDYGQKNSMSVPTPKGQTMGMVAIVGSGPAGLSCAYHLRLLGYGVKVFERATLAGGMLRWGIPDYRLPRTILDKEIERLQDMGIEIQTNASIGREFLTEGLKEFNAIFLALGVSKDLSLGIPGEGSPGVISGLDFLRQTKEGKNPRLGNRVTVIGGGNTAIDVARTALRLGSKPSILYRRTRSEMPAVAEEVDEALKEGASIEFLTSPIAITRRERNGMRMECVRNRLDKIGPDGRRTLISISDSNFSIDSDTTIVAIGETIDPEWKEAWATVDEWGITSIPGVFAGGDLTGSPRTVSHAIGSGKKVAMAIDTFARKLDKGFTRPILLGSLGSLSMAQWMDPSSVTHRNNEVVKYKDLNHYYFEPMSRQRMPQVSNRAMRINSFEEVNLGFSKEVAIQEAERCFQCGICSYCENCYIFCPDSAAKIVDQHKVVEIDYEFCKGCGICAYECPSHFIEMVREEK